MKLTQQTEKKIERIIKENPEMEAAVFLRKGNYIFITKNRLDIFKPVLVVDNYFIYIRFWDDPDIKDFYFRKYTKEMEMLNKWSDLGYWDYTVFYQNQ